MGYYGQEMCTYQYYDKTLKLKKMDDPEDERMLDLLFQNRTFDLGAVYDWAGPTAGMLQFYTSMIGSESSEIISEARLLPGRDRCDHRYIYKIAKQQKGRTDFGSPFFCVRFALLPLAGTLRLRCAGRCAVGFLPLACARAAA